MADMSTGSPRTSPSTEVCDIEERLTSATVSQPSRRAITKASHSQPEPGIGNISHSYQGQLPHNHWNPGFPQPYIHPANVNPSIGHRQPYVHNGYTQAQFVAVPQHTYSPTPYHSFDRPAYAKQSGQTSAAKSENSKSIRFIRPALSPEVDHDKFEFREETTGVTDDVAKSAAVSGEVDSLATKLVKSLATSTSIPTTQSSVWSKAAASSLSTDLEDSDSDAEDSLSHPNKFPVEIEYHDNKYCLYRRQPTGSGLKVKHIKSTMYDPMTSESRNQQQQIKYYQKDLVRICRCGAYSQMDGALVHGRANDCDGYEIHYSQKCKWKAYDDYKTGKRVLIRLCKCYKPMA